MLITSFHTRQVRCVGRHQTFSTFNPFEVFKVDIGRVLTKKLSIKYVSMSTKLNFITNKIKCSFPFGGVTFHPVTVLVCGKFFSYVRRYRLFVHFFSSCND